MRTLSFPNFTRWDFQGTVNAAAVALGDIDDDGDAEFAVGNGAGSLAIFKGLDSSKPWRTSSGLGTVSLFPPFSSICFNVKWSSLLTVRSPVWPLGMS
jgi:hypothetical protein